MKRYIFIAAALVLATVSCSKVYDATPVNHDVPIGFGTWVETMTKATSNTIANSFTVDDNFKVWGSKYVTSSDTRTDVFSGVTVTKTLNDPETWTYTTKQYWDTSVDNYTFFGVSPAADGYTVNTASGEITASPTITFTGKDSDIMVAQKAVVNKNDGSGNFNSFAAVPMVFNHVAALVDVIVKPSAGLVAAGANVQVSAIELQNISKEGTFTVAADFTTAPAATWTPSTPAAGTVAAYNQASGVSSGAANLNTNLAAAGAMFIQSLVVMPQNFRNSGDYIQKLDIDYNITQTGGTANSFTPDPFALTLFDNTENSSNEGDTNVTGWAPGVHYIYVVTIDARAIEFTASISAWGDPIYAYNYLVN